MLDARLKTEHDLPLGQFEFMRYLSQHGTARVYDLAHWAAITVGATSKAVDRLEVSGRCRRTANPHDRRSSLVSLTPEGERILAAAAPTVEAELQTWVGSVLPERTLEELATMLSMLRQRAEVDPRTDRIEPGPHPTSG